MSGHSKWSTIKRQKGAADAKRGAAFTKLGNAIAIAVREGGGGDPESNFRLRLAVEKAREANMPKENIQRSIDRGLGKIGEASLEAAVYEGFGPGGASIIVETITDNSTRTANELRGVFSKNGGSLGTPGSVAYLFSKVGEIEIAGGGGVTFERVFERAVEAGAQDAQEKDGIFWVYTKPTELHQIKAALETAGIGAAEAAVVYRPNRETMVEVGEEDGQRLGKLLGAVDELDDVQEVYVNAEFIEAT